MTSDTQIVFAEQQACGHILQGANDLLEYYYCVVTSRHFAAFPGRSILFGIGCVKIGMIHVNTPLLISDCLVLDWPSHEQHGEDTW